MTLLATPPAAAELAPRLSAGDGRIVLTAEQLAEHFHGRPPEHLEAFEWLRKHCVLNGLTYETAAKKLQKPGGGAYSRDSVYQALTGQRGLETSLEPLCAAILRYRRNVETPEPVNGFIKTRMAREIETYIRRVADMMKIGFIVGQNACGKTTTYAQLDRTYRDITLLRMPEGGHLSAFLIGVAKRRGLGDRQTVRDLSNRIISEFEPGHKVIIDEADQCFRARSSNLGNKTLDYLRRAWDEGGWALTLGMDPAGYKKLITVDHSDPLRRLYSRRHAPLVLPAFYREDLDLFAAHHGLEPSPGVKHKVTFGTDSYEDIPRQIEEKLCRSHRDGLLVWLGLLREAKALATTAGKDVSWNWVLKAYALHLNMESAAVAVCGGPVS